MTIRLAIINDYEVVVRGLADMLRSHSDELEIVELDARVEVHETVDIALYDTFAQTQGDGPDVAQLIRNRAVRKVVVYTWNTDPRLVDLSLEQGVAGYLSKALPADELVDALKAVHAGERVVSTLPPDAPVVAENWPGRAEGLTMREAEVIALITQGLSNAEIAHRASLSINSVKSYIRSGYRKMGVTSRTNAVLWGIEHGFVPHRMRITPRQE